MDTTFCGILIAIHWCPDRSMKSHVSFLSEIVTWLQLSEPYLFIRFPRIWTPSRAVAACDKIRPARLYSGMPHGLLTSADPTGSTFAILELYAVDSVADTLTPCEFSPASGKAFVTSGL